MQRVFIMTLAIVWICVVTVYASAPSPQPLEKARQALSEQSYAIAARYFEQAFSQQLDEPERREATYGRAICTLKLGETEQARQAFEKLLQEPREDKWRGLALWQLSVIQARDGVSPDEETSLSKQIEEADRIITQKASESYGEFARSVIDDIFPYWWPTRAREKEFQIRFFDKTIEATKKEADIAELHRRRAEFRYQRMESGEQIYIHDLRAIVREFPKTSAARQAQLSIAHLVTQRGKLKAALEEWKRLVELGPESAEAREAQRNIEQITKEFLDLEINPSALPGQAIRVGVAARNVNSCAIVLYRVKPEEALRVLQADPSALEKLIKTDAPIVTKRVELPRRDDYRGTTTSVIFDPARPTEHFDRGMYVVACRGDNARAYRLVVIGNLTLMATTSGRELHFWTVTSSDGRPRTRARLLLWLEDQGARKVGRKHPKAERNEEIVELTTDENGFAKFQFAAGVTSTRFAAVALDGDDCALLSQQSTYFEPRVAQATCYVYTDRPAYRPGDRVFWRAILRELQEGDYKLPKNTRFKVTVISPRGEKASAQECVANDFGTASGEWTIASGASLGLWRIALSDSKGTEIGSAQFRVEEYKKPEFIVTVTAQEKLVRWGTSVTAQISAQYLFGAPVANAAVHYTVTARPRYWWSPLAPWARGLSWFDGDARQVPPPLYFGDGVRVAEGKATTNASGICSVSFLAKCPERMEKHEVTTYDFVITASVTDPSRRVIDGSASIAVGKKALNVNVRSERSVLSPGDMAVVTIETRNIGGDMVGAKGTIAVEKLTWDELKGNEIPTTLSLEKIEVPPSGELTYQWRLPKDLVGRVRMLFIAEDPFAGTSVDACIINVADDQTQDLGIRYQGIQLIPNKSSYEIGETARILVLSEYPEVSAWFFVDTGSGFVLEKLAHLRYRTNFLEVPITEAYVPNVQIAVAAVRGRQVLSHHVELLVPPKRRILQVDVRTDRDSYRPREKGTLEIKVRSWDGKPVRGEFSVSVYDKAIEYIQASMRGDVRQFFYGHKRRISVEIANSLVAPALHRSTLPPPGPYDYDLFASMGSESELGNNDLRDVFVRSRRAETTLMPASAPDVAMMRAAASKEQPAEAKERGGAFAQPVLRTDFRDSIVWLPNVVTDKNGMAHVTVTFPDSLTTWRIEVVGVDEKHRVGEDSTLTLVQKNISARLALPRFLVERDRATVSAIVRNDYSDTKTVLVHFNVAGVELSDRDQQKREQELVIAPASEARLDWRVEATRAGTASMSVVALAREESDATETSIPVIAHGLDKKVFRVGSTSDITTGTRRVEHKGDVCVISDEIFVPSQRILESSRLALRLSPSLAAQLRDALPYLVEYPYGCVEQTMSRFLPAAIVAKTFQDLEIPRDQFLEERLPEVLRAGIERLRDFQHNDGSWGWWKEGPTDAYMSAHVMYGLTLAREADCEIPDEMLSQGLEFLSRRAHALADAGWSSLHGSHYENLQELHALAYGTLVLAMNNKADREAMNRLWEQRENLSPVGLAMLGRALALTGQTERANIVLRNLMNFAVEMPDNDTVHWESRTQSGWYWWWNDNVEATCHALMAYLDTSPKASEIDRAVKWLVLNRRGSQWKSTKDTGLAVMALAQYLKLRRPDAQPTRIVAKLGAFPEREFNIGRENFFAAAPDIILEGKAVPDGIIPLRLEVEGPAPVYYELTAEYFTREEPITSASHELVVERSYDICVKSEKREDGHIEDMWEPLRDGDEIRSGDKVRVTLRVHAYNDYEYLVFEDPKPAGCEAVEIRSGWTCDDGLCCYREMRDQVVTSFVGRLPQGEHRLSYELRAETPGKFHTLPARGYAMYCPDLYGSSDELRVTVLDRK
ncbi:MAG: MG2 domain-containing protein [Candidatus Sumerlaeaceae bacterium]